MGQQSLDRRIGLFQLRLGKLRMDLAMADAVQHLRFPSAAALGHKMVLVALLGRHHPAAERADIGCRRLIPGGDVLVSFSRHGAKLNRSPGQPARSQLFRFYDAFRESF